MEERRSEPKRRRNVKWEPCRACGAKVERMVVPKAAGMKCHQCEEVVNMGRRMWRCEVCRRVECPPCKAKGEAARMEGTSTLPSLLHRCEQTWSSSCDARRLSSSSSSGNDITGFSVGNAQLSIALLLRRFCCRQLPGQ